MRIQIQLALLITLFLSFRASAFEPKQGPLMTPFAKDVDIKAPWPEYPRPQLVRTDWQNLNGVWQYQPGQANDAAPIGKDLSSQILVPFAVESALSGVMEHHDRLWYRRTFSVPAAWAGQHVILHFDAVDYESEVFINGQSAGVHHGGYDAFNYDITPLLKPAGEQELIVRVFDPTEAGGQPRGKQTTTPGGIMYTPTTGIWQTVWMEPVPANSIQSLHVVPDIDNSSVGITVSTTDSASPAPVHVRVLDGSTEIAAADTTAGKEVSIKIPAPKLWSPDRPFLYGLEISLTSNAADLKSPDKITSYFGMRKISLGDDHGVKKLFLNNRFLFEFGPLDQGFWPDGIYTPPTDAAVKNDIAQMKSLGFNMVRKHIKVEPDRWYYYTDSLGLLVWQDMPSCNSYLGRNNKRPPVDTDAYATQLDRMVQLHWNHPSIIMWVTFNESQGQHDTAAIVQHVKQMDPSRLVNEASGGRREGSGDVYDIHSYPEPNCPPPTPGQALVCGEFGGVRLMVPGHTWADHGHGYIDATDPAELLFLYSEYARQVKDLRDRRGLSAVVYTQLTDVETEINGLLTYDRQPKLDNAAVAAATTFALPEPVYKVIVATSEKEPQSWSFKFDQPVKAWPEQNFADQKWETGPAPFSKGEGGHTAWTTPDIWIRRHFNPGHLSTDEINRLVLRDRHAFDMQVYINGQLACTQRRSTFDYRYNLLTPAGKTAIKPDADNILAVHCQAHNPARNIENAPFIDVGIDERDQPQK